jgi:hypothetical protein
MVAQRLHKCPVKTTETATVTRPPTYHHETPLLHNRSYMTTAMRDATQMGRMKFCRRGHARSERRLLFAVVTTVDSPTATQLHDHPAGSAFLNPLMPTTRELDLRGAWCDLFESAIETQLCLSAMESRLTCSGHTEAQNELPTQRSPSTSSHKSQARNQSGQAFDEAPDL